MRSSIETKSFEFAVRIVNLCKYLNKEKREFTLANQLLKSGTSIGANVAEAAYAQSKADFLSKMCIARKEASETMYWLKLLYATGFLTGAEYESISSEGDALFRILCATCKTASNNLKSAN